MVQETKVRFKILVDCSGSMSGRRMHEAIKACYLLATSLQKLKIPFSIVGHSADGRHVKMIEYIDFEHCRKKESLMKLGEGMESVQNLYKEHVVVEDVFELGDQLLKTIRQIILG